MQLLCTLFTVASVALLVPLEVSAIGLQSKNLIPILSSLSSIAIGNSPVDLSQRIVDRNVMNQYTVLLSDATISSAAVEPSDKDNQMVQIAFRDFDLKRFDDSEKEFTESIQRWKQLNRPRDEIVSLLKARCRTHFSQLIDVSS